jgi:hypothetical protein
MFVRIPWKNGSFPLRPHQLEAIEYDAKGPFLRVRNAETARWNKCRVSLTSASPKKAPSAKKASPKKGPPSPKTATHPLSLEDLVGKRVTGTVAQTGPHYFALLVDRIEGLSASSAASLGVQLVRMARQYLSRKGVPWSVATPRSWSIPVHPQRELGPHVSLSDLHRKDVGKQVALTVTGVMHWEENSRWVALRLKGPLVDHTDWVLHLSCAQQPL